MFVVLMRNYTINQFQSNLNIFGTFWIQGHSVNHTVRVRTIKNGKI